MGGGGRGGPRVSPLGIDLARRGTVFLPSLISLLPHILASIILRSTTPDPSSENPSWNRTRIRSVHLPPEFPFGLALLADEVSEPKMSGEIVGGTVTADSTSPIVLESSRCERCETDCDTTFTSTIRYHYITL